MVKAYRLHANSYLVKPGSYEQFVELMAEVERYWLRQNSRADPRRHAASGAAACDQPANRPHDEIS